MTYFIVEDQSDALDLIRKYLMEDYPQLTAIGFTKHPQAAIEQISILKPDLLLLDINLGGMDAFQLLDELQIKNNMSLPLIIFISAYVDTDHILKAFEYYPLRYITKPIERSKLCISIDQAIHQHNLLSEHTLQKTAIRSFQLSKLRIPKLRGEIELIDLNQILFFQTFHEGQITQIYTNQNAPAIKSAKHLGYFKDLLSNYHQFFSISQSILVNLNYLKSYSHQTKKVILHQWPEYLSASRRGGEELKRWLTGE